VIDRLSTDLRRELPGMQGLSARNLKYMRALAEAYPDEPFVQQVVAQLPWGHNVRLLDAVKNPTEREWYLRQTIQHGWSRSVLVHQIEGGLYARQGKALTNFDRTLPEPQSDLARQVLKDPYNFDFLSLGPEAKERDLERSLLEHVRDFLLELGAGFALVGSQYPLDVAGEEYRSHALKAVEEASQAVQTPLARVEHALLKPAAFLIIPVFALANAGVTFKGAGGSALQSPVAWGVLVGLLAGKPVGILLAAWATTKAGWASLPEGTTWRQLVGVAVLCGIGFTMSLFVAQLAFPGQEEQLAATKVGIFAASLLAAVVGGAILRSKAAQ
jgi:predicted nuclease of restriction endonuclease-like (RecB) superfamily